MLKTLLFLFVFPTGGSQLSDARHLSKTDPLGALPFMIWAAGNISARATSANSMTVDSGGGSSRTLSTNATKLLELSANAFDELAELESLLRRHSAAAGSRKLALHARLRAANGTATISDLVTAYAGIAKEYQSARAYDSARSALSAARKAADSSGVASTAVDSVLLFMDAALLDCTGDGVGALAAYDEGLRIRGGDVARSPAETVVLLEHLWHAASGPPRLKNRTLREQINSRIKSMSSALVRTGPWERSDQLPQLYERGLSAAPWHDLRGPNALWASITEPVAAVLAAAAPALRAEFMQLKELGLLLEENECIHTGGSGKWQWFATNGFWTPLDKNGCAISTPAACALLHSVAVVAPLIRIERAGYSAIDGAVTLRPHCGRTNAQLKFHLGLIIPRKVANGEPCAHLTVGNETRAWKEGSVLFFDDSYIHSVKHECDEERVVFQLVITHPDKKGKGGGDRRAGI